MPSERLSTLVAREAPLEPLRVVQIVGALLDALQTIHAARLAHGALRPSVIAVDGDNVEITGFPSVDAIDAHAYRAPERTYDGRHADVRADVWSAGVIAYELATGQRPFGGEGAALDEAIRTLPLRPVRDVAPWVPPDLSFAIEHALVKQPSGRWSSAEAFARALRAASLEGHVVVVPPPESRGSAFARTSIAPSITTPMAATVVTIPVATEHRASRPPYQTALRVVTSAALLGVVLVVGLLLRAPTSSTPATPTPAPTIDEAQGETATTKPFAPKPIPLPRFDETPSPKPTIAPKPSISGSARPSTSAIVLPPIVLPPFLPLPTPSTKKPKVGGK